METDGGRASALAVFRDHPLLGKPQMSIARPIFAL